LLPSSTAFFLIPAKQGDHHYQQTTTLSRAPPVCVAAAAAAAAASAPPPIALPRRMLLVQPLGMISAKDLLYQDQQDANARRAAVEETLLYQKEEGKIPNLEAPKIKAARVASGSGFGGGGASSASNKQQQSTNKKKSAGTSGSTTSKPAQAPAKTKKKNNKTRSSSPLAIEQAKIVTRDGVLRIDKALSPALADAVREHVLEEQRLADEATSKNAHVSREYYGVENRRKKRCDLLLSLVAPEEQEQEESSTTTSSKHNAAAIQRENIMPKVLNELLGQDGTLRLIYEELVTMEGEFYELAAVITDPGSDRQQIHPDLPFRQEAPLYVIFLALQDVTESMGPTTFLLGSQSYEERVKFDDLSQRDEQLATANSRLALLKKGDAVLFDARLLHCGNANDELNGATRAMLNFSFRNPKETGNLGYCGSMRPGYVGAMTLGDVTDALLQYDMGDEDPFARYGNGLVLVDATEARTTTAGGGGEF